VRSALFLALLAAYTTSGSTQQMHPIADLERAVVEHVLQKDNDGEAHPHPRKRVQKVDGGGGAKGALDCAKGWLHDASKKTKLTAPADAIPLRIDNPTTDAAVHDFAITSADAEQAGRC
jgi:hypothetical protein